MDHIYYYNSFWLNLIQNSIESIEFNFYPLTFIYSISNLDKTKSILRDWKEADMTPTTPHDGSMFKGRVDSELLKEVDTLMTVSCWESTQREDRNGNRFVSTDRVPVWRKVLH